MNRLRISSDTFIIIPYLYALVATAAVCAISPVPIGYFGNRRRSARTALIILSIPAIFFLAVGLTPGIGGPAIVLFFLPAASVLIGFYLWFRRLR
jgi:hypothetical protein